jgi:uncharacterized protein YlxW (UPF0749 family)
MTEPIEEPTPPDGDVPVDEDVAVEPTVTAEHDDADQAADPRPDTDPAGEDAAGEDAAGEDAAGEDPPSEDPPGEDPPGEDAVSEEPALVAAARRPMWRRVLFPRLTGASAIIALLVGLLGFALIAQVRSNSSTADLSNDRPEDLVRILSDLDDRKDRLNNEIAQLKEQQRQLSSGAQSRQAALDAARQRADELGILAGTLPAQGPGLVITMQPPPTVPVADSTVVDAVEALRDSGAEAMQIAGANGPVVRIVASTSFVATATGVNVDGENLIGSLTITAIGDPQTMAPALTIPGEVDDVLKGAGGKLLIEQPGTVTVGALHTVTPARYAHPIS